MYGCGHVMLFSLYYDIYIGNHRPNQCFLNYFNRINFSIIKTCKAKSFNENVFEFQLYHFALFLNKKASTDNNS